MKRGKIMTREEISKVIENITLFDGYARIYRQELDGETDLAALRKFNENFKKLYDLQLQERPTDNGGLQTSLQEQEHNPGQKSVLVGGSEGIN